MTRINPETPLVTSLGANEEVTRLAMLPRPFQPPKDKIFGAHSGRINSHHPRFSLALVRNQEPFPGSHDLKRLPPDW
jgi:hypothetical protein